MNNTTTTPGTHHGEDAAATIARLEAELKTERRQLEHVKDLLMISGSAEDDAQAEIAQLEAENKRLKSDDEMRRQIVEQIRAGILDKDMLLRLLDGQYSAVVAELAKLREGFATLRSAVITFSSRPPHLRDDHCHCVLCEAVEKTRELADAILGARSEAAN